MQGLIILLSALVSLQLTGQQPTLPGPIDPSVRNYLSLNEDQVRAVEALRATLLQGQKQRDQRRLEALQVIQGQTLAADPDAAVLGGAYADLVTLDREDAAAWKKLGEDTRKILTPEQSARLQPLKTVQELRTLTMKTECQGFLEFPKTTTSDLGSPGILIPPSRFVLITDASGSCGFGLLTGVWFPSATRVGKARSLTSPNLDPLASYLDMSAAQITAIAKLRQQAEMEQSTRESRSIQVRNEITEESGKDTLDIMALGLRYLELEVIRREGEAASKALTLAIQAQLNAAQRAKLAAIEDARKFADLDAMAQSQGFLTRIDRGQSFLP